MTALRLGSLFDGIGVFPLAAVRCGIEPVWVEMSRNVQSGNTQNLKSTVIQRSFPKWSVAERRKTAAASDQAACLRLRPLPVLRRRQSQRVARIDPNAVVVGKNIAENDRFDLFSRQLVRRDLVDLLFLERGEKALHPCVVEAMSGAAEALYHAAARQLGTKS